MKSHTNGGAPTFLPCGIKGSTGPSGLSSKLGASRMGERKKQIPRAARDDKLRDTGHETRVTSHEAQVTGHESRVTPPSYQRRARGEMAADFLAAIVREFGQWLSHKPRSFVLFAPGDRCFLSLHQVSLGGRNRRAGKLARRRPVEKRRFVPRIPADEETLRKRNLLGSVAPADCGRGRARRKHQADSPHRLRDRPRRDYSTADEITARSPVHGT